MAGVTVTIDGTKSQPEPQHRQTAAGFYKFTGLGFDTYTVTPFLENYGFTPPFRISNHSIYRY